MQSRAQFGMYGTALPNLIVVLMYIGYFTSSAILGGQAVASLLHVTTTEGIIIINAFVLLITVFGYDMFHAYNRIVTFLSIGAFLAILIKLLTILPSHLPAGDNSAGNILLAISVFVAWQVTWAPYVSDYSRYMPEDTSSAKVFSYTYIGSVAGASLVMVIGAIAAVVAKDAVAANAPDYLAGLLGSAKWLFLIIFILGVGAGNFGNLYGPYLTFMAIISPSGKLASKTTGRTARLIATTVVAIIGTLIAIKASSNFIHDLTNFLVFTLYLLVPWTAINLTDFYLVQHGKYEIPELFKVHGKYGTYNWFALAVYVAAVGVQFPFMNNEWIVGSAATAMGGADIAWIVGFVFAAVVYYIGARAGIAVSARLGREDAEVLTESSV
jgi:NCS1 family nucleobase:cation symporter-1